MSEAVFHLCCVERRRSAWWDVEHCERSMWNAMGTSHDKVTYCWSRCRNRVPVSFLKWMWKDHWDHSLGVERTMCLQRRQTPKRLRGAIDRSLLSVTIVEYTRGSGREATNISMRSSWASLWHAAFGLFDAIPRRGCLRLCSP